MPEFAGSKNHQVDATPARADQVVDDKVNGTLDAAADAVAAGILKEDYTKVLGFIDRGDVAGFGALVRTFSPAYREQMKQQLIRAHRFDAMPMAMQMQLAPDSPFHQESKIDSDGGIYCTTAVRIEGVTAADALAALTRTDWKSWWHTSSTSGAPPNFEFVPEAPLKAIPGFHLDVAMGDPIAEGNNWRLPAKLNGTFTGPAEMYIESVAGGVVIHDTWMGMQLQNFAMEHVGGAKFWMGGHLDALRGQMFGGLLGATGFAGLRNFLLGGKK